MTIHVSFIDGSTRRDLAWEAGRTLARDMLAYLRDGLAAMNGTLTDITAIGVFRGPGSYTGLRIGLTVMNTLASSLGVPIVGTNSEDWQSVCLARLEAGENDRLVLPDYGGDAHITKPRK